MIVRFINREIAQRCQDGVDYSAAGQVLLRARNLMLVWRYGRNYWSARSQAYAQAGLQTVPVPGADNWRVHSRRVGEQGGRLSERKLAQAMPDIDGTFGEGTTEAVIKAYRLGRTALLP